MAEPAVPAPDARRRYRPATLGSGLICAADSVPHCASIPQRLAGQVEPNDRYWRRFSVVVDERMLDGADADKQRQAHAVATQRMPGLPVWSADLSTPAA